MSTFYMINLDRFDIIIDENLKPWLLEINYTPSFKCNSHLDLRIKKGLIRNTLNLINVTKTNSIW